jgi:class 3 adenylate cyclase
VNLASRIADHARGGQVLVSEPVVAMTSVAGVRFDDRQLDPEVPVLVGYRPVSDG